MPLRFALPLGHVVLALAGVVALVAAQAASAAMSADDVSVLAGACVNCHAPPAQANGLIPLIHGRDEAFLRQRLAALRAAPADASATVMPRLLKAYNEAQLDALARWFSQQTVQTPQATQKREVR